MYIYIYIHIYIYIYIQRERERGSTPLLINSTNLVLCESMPRSISIRWKDPLCFEVLASVMSIIAIMIT